MWLVCSECWCIDRSDGKELERWWWRESWSICEEIGFSTKDWNQQTTSIKFYFLITFWSLPYYVFSQIGWIPRLDIGDSHVVILLLHHHGRTICRPNHSLNASVRRSLTRGTHVSTNKSREKIFFQGISSHHWLLSLWLCFFWLCKSQITLSRRCSPKVLPSILFLSLAHQAFVVSRSFDSFKNAI